MIRIEKLMLGCLLLSTTAAISQMNSAPQPQPNKKTSQKTPAMRDERGKQVFDQNCLRCHREPQGFSPSVSGTIAMHMRVRAGLSDDDYKALMKFFNP